MKAVRLLWQQPLLEWKRIDSGARPIERQKEKAVLLRLRLKAKQKLLKMQRNQAGRSCKQSVSEQQYRLCCFWRQYKTSQTLCWMYGQSSSTHSFQEYAAVLSDPDICKCQPLEHYYHCRSSGSVPVTGGVDPS